VLRVFAGARQQPRRRIEPEDLPHLRRIERKIETGADADIKDAALRGAGNPLAIGTQPLVAH
jgi:hypothetical protein